MIDKFCEYLVRKIKKKMPEIDEEQSEVILYGLQLIVGEIPKIILLFALGILLGLWWQTALAFLLILPYKVCSRRIPFKNTYWLFFMYKYCLLWKCFY